MGCDGNSGAEKFPCSGHFVLSQKASELVVVVVVVVVVEVVVVVVVVVVEVVVK